MPLRWIKVLFFFKINVSDIDIKISNICSPSQIYSDLIIPQSASVKGFYKLYSKQYLCLRMLEHCSSIRARCTAGAVRSPCTVCRMTFTYHGLQLPTENHNLMAVQMCFYVSPSIAWSFKEKVKVIFVFLSDFYISFLINIFLLSFYENSVQR